MIKQAIVKKFGKGEAVFIEEIADMFPEYKQAYLYRILAREVAAGEIIKFSPGVYSVAKNTVFGNIGRFEFTQCFRGEHAGPVYNRDNNE